MIEIIDKTVPTIKVDGVEKKVTIVIKHYTPYFEDEEGHLYEIPRETVATEYTVTTVTVEEYCKTDNNRIIDATYNKTVKGYLDLKLAWGDYMAYDKYYRKLYKKGYEYIEEPVDERGRQIYAIFQPEGYNFKLVRKIAFDIY